MFRSRPLLTPLVVAVVVLSLAAPASAEPLAPGQLLVSTADGRVLQLSPRGEIVGALDTGTGVLASTLGFDEAGRLWVALPGVGTAVAFDLSGEIHDVAALDGSGPTAAPFPLGVDPQALRPREATAWAAIVDDLDGRTAWAATAAGDLFRIDRESGAALDGPIALGGAVAGRVGGLAVVPADLFEGGSRVLGATADLAVTATVDVPDPGVGDPIVLTVTVENLGPDPATGVVVANPSLRGTRFDSVTASQGTWDETTERWTLEDLALGATATLTVDATVEGFCWGGRARVIASDVADPVQGNDTGLVERADVTYWVTAVGDGRSWSDPGNWTAGVPGAATTACVVGPGDYALFLDVDASIRRIGFGADEGIQTLRLDQAFTLTLAEPSFLAEPAGWAWDTGTIAGAGALTNDGTIRLRTSAEKTLAGTILNQGSIEWRAGDWTFDDGLVENDGLVEIQADATLAAAVGASGLLVDRGTVRKIAGAGTTTVDVFVDADGGTLEADTGVLALTAGGRLADATLSAAFAAAVDLEAGVFGVEGTLGGEPAGTVRTSPDATLSVGDGIRATLDLGGTGFAWEAGRMDAPGTMVNAGLMALDGAGDKVLEVILENDGTLRWDAGTLVFDDGLFQNDGLLDVVGDDAMQPAPGASGFFFQRGEMVKSAGAGETRVDVVVFLEPDSVTSVDSGTLAFPQETDHRPGATLRGDGGTVQFDAVIAAGTVAPGGAPGILSWEAEWLPTQSGALVVELGGLTPGSGHDQLQVTGPVTLAGTLTIELLDGFAPAPGDSFTVLTCSDGCQGAFDTVVEPPGAAFDIVVEPNQVRLVAVEPPTGPRLQIVGVCPGPMTLMIDGATPGGNVAVLRGSQEGPGVVPGGACAGTELGLVDPSPVARLVADGEGRAEKALDVPGLACGVPVEVVDLTACAASGVDSF